MKKGKTKRDFEKFIHKTIKKFTPILLMQRHIFEVQEGCHGKDSAMESHVRYPYLDVNIRYSLSTYRDWTKGEDVVPIIVHEMCHPITDPLYSKAVDRHATSNEINDERERLTDLICNIVLKQNGY